MWEISLFAKCYPCNSSLYQRHTTEGWRVKCASMFNLPIYLSDLFPFQPSLLKTGNILARPWHFYSHTINVLLPESFIQFFSFLAFTLLCSVMWHQRLAHGNQSFAATRFLFSLMTLPVNLRIFCLLFVYLWAPFLTIFLVCKSFCLTVM
jgi:hypothetical protein